MTMTPTIDDVARELRCPPSEVLKRVAGLRLEARWWRVQAESVARDAATLTRPLELLAFESPSRCPEYVQ